MHLYGDLVGFSRDLSQLSWVDGSKYLCATINNDKLRQWLRKNNSDGEYFYDAFKKQYAGLIPSAVLTDFNAVPKSVRESLLDALILGSGFPGKFKAISCSPSSISSEVVAETALSSEDGSWSLLNIASSNSNYYKNKYVLFNNDVVNPQMFIIIKPLEGFIFKELRVSKEGSSTITISILSDTLHGSFTEIFIIQKHNDNWFMLKRSGIIKRGKS